MSQLIDVTVQILARTEKAVMITDDGKRHIWLPLSQIEIEMKKDDELAEITLPEWLAKEKELI